MNFEEKSQTKMRIIESLFELLTYRVWQILTAPYLPFDSSKTSEGLTIEKERFYAGVPCSIVFNFLYVNIDVRAIISLQSSDFKRIKAQSQVVNKVVK